MLMEPGELRWPASEQTGDCINQDRKGRLPKLTARLAQRQAPLHPPIAFLTCGAMRAFAPQHPKTQGPLGPVIGRIHPMLTQKHPQRRHLPHQSPRQPTSVVRAFMIALDQGTKPGIPRPPLTARGWRLCHLTQPLEFFQRPRPTCRQLWMALFRQSSRGAYQMGQTGLTLRHPVPDTRHTHR